MNHQTVTRRHLLAASMLGGTSIFWSRSVAAAKNVQPLSFAIVTDTHLGRNDSKTPEKNWRQAISELNQVDVKFVLHLGDVVDRGREAQYPIYASTQALLKHPIHEIPGNHDPVELFTKHVSQEIDRTFDVNNVRFVLFNNAHRDSHDGFISEAQNKWIAEQCDAAARNDMNIVIGCHVPVHENRHPDRGWYVKPNDGQAGFYETVEKHKKRLLACLHGHFHNGIRGWRDHGHTVEVLCPSVCYNQNRQLAAHIANGKASGFFVDELRPGYVLAELGDGRFTMRYKPLGGDLNGEYMAKW